FGTAIIGSVPAEMLSYLDPALTARLLFACIGAADAQWGEVWLDPYGRHSALCDDVKREIEAELTEQYGEEEEWPYEPWDAPDFKERWFRRYFEKVCCFWG